MQINSTLLFIVTDRCAAGGELAHRIIYGVLTMSFSIQVFYSGLDTCAWFSWPNRGHT